MQTIELQEQLGGLNQSQTGRQETFPRSKRLVYFFLFTQSQTSNTKHQIREQNLYWKSRGQGNKWKNQMVQTQVRQ